MFTTREKAKDATHTFPNFSVNVQLERSLRVEKPLKHVHRALYQVQGGGRHIGFMGKLSWVGTKRSQWVPKASRESHQIKQE